MYFQTRGNPLSGSGSNITAIWSTVYDQEMIISGKRSQSVQACLYLTLKIINVQAIWFLNNFSRFANFLCFGPCSCSSPETTINQTPGGALDRLNSESHYIITVKRTNGRLKLYDIFLIDPLYDVWYFHYLRRRKFPACQLGIDSFYFIKDVGGISFPTLRHVGCRGFIFH